MKRMDKGFTLIELMIVVAIIGILAAVAVPGFMRYIKDSKTTEAKDNLKAITDGALAFFEADHVYDSAGMITAARLYPGTNKLNETYVPATSAQLLGSVTSTSTIGIKNSPELAATKAALKAAPWQMLKFQINKPYYYEYAYTSNGTQGQQVSKFAAGARASLSEDRDSNYIIKGTAEGKAGNILECDEGGNGKDWTIGDGEASCPPVS